MKLTKDDEDIVWENTIATIILSHNNSCSFGILNDEFLEKVPKDFHLTEKGLLLKRSKLQEYLDKSGLFMEKGKRVYSVIDPKQWDFLSDWERDFKPKAVKEDKCVQGIIDTKRENISSTKPKYSYEKNDWQTELCDDIHYD